MDEKIKNGEPVILLTQGKDDSLRAVTGMGNDGKLSNVDPIKENAGKFFNIIVYHYCPIKI